MTFACALCPLKNLHSGSGHRWSGVSDVMDGIDKDRIETFFETYSGILGPEFIA